MEYLMPVIHRTPLKYSHTLDALTGSNIIMKMENEQKTGSFKIRGALNKIFSLSDVEARRGVVAASAGNHAQGVAYSATLRGVTSKIYMPEHAPISKVNATSQYGAKVVLKGESYQDAYENAVNDQRDNGMTFVHAFDDRNVIAGQGTLGFELMQQCQNIDAILVPVGGGGLLSGIAIVIKELFPHVKLIGVQASVTPATYNAFKGKKVDQGHKAIPLADGIAVKQPGELTLPIIKKYVDDIVTVTEEEIAYAMLLLLEREKALVEGAAATPLAALLFRNLSLEGKNVSLILSGGNTDLSRLQQCEELSKKINNSKKIG
jgi:threonine dehydratase